MRNPMALGVLVGLLLVVAGCNPFLDRLRGEFPILSLVRVDSSISASKAAATIVATAASIATSVCDSP